MIERFPIRIEVNGRKFEDYVAPNQSLIEVLRTQAGATDVKYGCGEGVCGTCTVLMDGDPVNSCHIFAVQADGTSITTLGGLVDEETGLHPLQRAFLKHGGAQCGFCTPGMVLTARWLLDRNPSAGREEIREAIAGNLCRCTGYRKILDAIEDCADGGRRHGD